ncbi:hypothetical protein C8J56DRAFT_879811 [Mycena floridula]|nr:hypothetical protein C8J56DRAFT_879811 [Mycena floridula]
MCHLRLRALVNLWLVSAVTCRFEHDGTGLNWIVTGGNKIWRSKQNQIVSCLQPRPPSPFRYNPALPGVAGPPGCSVESLFSVAQGIFRHTAGTSPLIAPTIPQYCILDSWAVSDRNLARTVCLGQQSLVSLQPSKSSPVLQLAVEQSLASMELRR